MKISILQENLHRSLQDVSRFVSTKPQLPILSSVLMEGKEGQLSLYATDLHTGMKTSTGGKIEKSGSFAAPSKLFTEYISSLSPGMLELEVLEDSLVVSGERSRATFQGSSVEDFPPFPKSEGKKVEISKDLFVEMVEKGGMSAGVDESRPILSSILIEVIDGIISVVSTDGYRLSKKTSTKTDGWKDGRILLPAKSLREVTRIIAKGVSKKVEIVISEELGQVCVIEGDNVFLLRVVEGSFPDYAAIIPPSFETEISFNREEALSNLRRAMIFSRESSSIVRFSIKKEELILQSSTSSMGEHSGSILSTLKKGGEVEIAFNGKYVQEFLSSIKEEQIHFVVNESLRPGMFFIEKDDTFFYLVMPFRLQQESAEK